MLYSVKFDDQDSSEYERFVDDPDCQACPEFDELDARLEDMLERTGFEQRFFRTEKYDPPLAVLARGGGELRMYCCVMRRVTLVAGYGGRKPRHVRTLQEVPTLKAAFDRMRYVARRVDARIREDGTLWITDDGEFEGDTRFDAED